MMGARSNHSRMALQEISRPLDHVGDVPLGKSGGLTPCLHRRVHLGFIVARLREPDEGFHVLKEMREILSQKLHRRQ